MWTSERGRPCSGVIRNGAARIIDNQTQAVSEGALVLSTLKIERAVKAGYREVHGGR
jgi:hypothetical protein